jgi:hypothetical protein
MPWWQVFSKQLEVFKKDRIHFSIYKIKILLLYGSIHQNIFIFILTRTLFDDQRLKGLHGK